MSEPLWFYRLGKTLVAADDEAEEALAPMATGEAFPIRFERMRNPGHHRKWWSCVRMVFMNQEKFDTITHLHTAIKIQAGWYDGPHISEEGRACYIPRSIAFGSMDQTEFERYYREGLVAILRVLPTWASTGEITTDLGLLRLAVEEYQRDERR